MWKRRSRIASRVFADYVALSKWVVWLGRTNCVWAARPEENNVLLGVSHRSWSRGTHCPRVRSSEERMDTQRDLAWRILECFLGSRHCIGQSLVDLLEPVLKDISQAYQYLGLRTVKVEVIRSRRLSCSWWRSAIYSRAAKRYRIERLERKERRKEESEARSEDFGQEIWAGGWKIGFKPREPGVAEESFLALANWIERLARQHLPVDPGRFHVDIVCMMLRNLDLETWWACMGVSTTFRDIYQ